MAAWPSLTSSSTPPSLVRAQRVRWLRVCVVSGLLVCVARAGQFSVLEGETLSRRAEANYVAEIRLTPPRGNIYDAQGRPLAVNVSAYSVALAPYRTSREDLSSRLALMGQILGLDLLAKEQEVWEVRPRWTPVELARGLTLEQVAPLFERRPNLPGLRISEDRSRAYPLGGTGAHLVGYTGLLAREELDKAKAEGLARSARVGRSGLEKYYEKELRGNSGLEVIERDRRGRQVRTRSERAGRPGADLFTTIDSDLQRVADSLLAGRKGVIVAMDPWTGGILALASRPGFDPRRPASPAQEGEDVSYLNRAVMQHYPPGSPFKLATALGLLENGIAADHEVFCQGYFVIPEYPAKKFWDQNNKGGYGWIEMTDALMVSSNVFFYDAGHRLGAARLLEAAGRMGFDRPTGIDLPGEVGGTLKGLQSKTNLSPGEMVLMGIGQGPLAVTPVQMLRATGVVATRGVLVRPHVGRLLVDSVGNETALERAEDSVRLDVKAGHWESIVQGMFKACNQPRGTAYKAEFPPSWRVCGKTGTAERPPGEPDAWFVGFAPRETPEIAVVVMLEHSGHGGLMAAPLARDLMAEWFERPAAGPRAPVVSQAERRDGAGEAVARGEGKAADAGVKAGGAEKGAGNAGAVNAGAVNAGEAEIRGAEGQGPVFGPEAGAGPTPLPGAGGAVSGDGGAGTGTGAGVGQGAEDRERERDRDHSHDRELLLRASGLSPGGGVGAAKGEDAGATTTTTLSVAARAKYVYHPSGSRCAPDSSTTRSLVSMNAQDRQDRPASDFDWSNGAIVRGPRDEKKIALIFTGGDFAEGTEYLLDVLKDKGFKGSFFFTGGFLENPENERAIRRLVAEGHYLGPHSHEHLLYCDWTDRKKTLVTREQFREDLEKNLAGLERFGVRREEVTWWIPPYEWYNEEIAKWSLEMGLRLFNFSPGTLSHTDYTEAGAKNYRSSDQIFQSILDRVFSDGDGLNGYLLLTHVGAGAKRTDKFFLRMPMLLEELECAMKYEFVRVDELLAGAPETP